MITLQMVPTDSIMIDLIAKMNAVGSGAGLKNTERALSAISGAIASTWQREVGSKYTINRDRISPFNHKVYSQDDMVHWLEYGLPSFDMKSTHTKGKKSRVVKPKLGRGGKLITEWKQKRKDGSEYTVRAGDTYLIIPFRHRTTKQREAKEGEVTLDQVYSKIRSQVDDTFQKSEVITSAADSQKIEPNYWGEQIKRAEYSWGSRIQFPEDDKYRNLRGMVAMKTERNQSSYMTFRVVSVNSPAEAWIHPGIKAKRILQNILERNKDQLQGIFDEAIRRDFT